MMNLLPNTCSFARRAFPCRPIWLRCRILGAAALQIATLMITTQAIAQDDANRDGAAAGTGVETNPPPPEWTEDSWQINRDKITGVETRTRPLTLHLRDESRPALHDRLMPDNTVPGNSAIYYLKAMGFLEQQNARAAIAKLHQQWFEETQASGETLDKLNRWLSSDPQKIDLEQANHYLSLHRFQSRELREAARRRSFDLDRRIDEVDDPISYLLPEIQTMRQLSRVQSLRTRVALAENRVDDAIECLQQQFALANHLGEEPFLVSSLVGVAIGRIALNDTLYLMQQGDAPNLYWAIATLPQPLVELSNALEYELGVLYHQLKPLKQVDRRPRSPDYWNDFLDRLAPRFGYLATELGLSADPDDDDAVRQAIVAYVIAGYPGAKRFLVEELKMTPEQVAAYTPTHAVMLATVRYYDIARDEIFKYFQLPYWKIASLPRQSIPQQIERDAKRFGLITRPSKSLLPAITAVRDAQARSAQMLAALKTIEAIRIYATRNDGRFPPSLDGLPLPAGIDPVTGKPPRYTVDGNTVLLTGGAIKGLQYRFRLSIAAENSN